MSQGFGSKRIQLLVPHHIIHRHSSSLPSEVRVPTKRLKFSLPCHSWPLVSSPCKQSGSGDKVPISASDVRPWFGLLLQKSDSAHSINEDCHTNSHTEAFPCMLQLIFQIDMLQLPCTCQHASQPLTFARLRASARHQAAASLVSTHGFAINCPKCGT